MKKTKRRSIVVCLLIAAVFMMPLYSVNIDATNEKSLVVPNDPGFINQWALNNTGQTGGTPDCDIDAPEAWDIETGNGNIVVAIIDSGIDYKHPELADKIWTNEDEIPDNGIDDDNNGYVDDVMGYDCVNNDADPRDDHGHGTWVAGVIGAATNNGIGIAGVCWDCKIMPVKVWNKPPYADLTLDIYTEGIKYAADNGADVICMSSGEFEENLTPEQFKQSKETADYAYSRGCVLVAAAGNFGRRDPFLPAAFDNVIGVAGTDHMDKRMADMYGSSNYGDWVDVAAPGEDIFTTSPTYACWATDNEYPFDYAYVTGTSFSTPIVAGLAALLLSQDPSLSNDEVRKIIRANVDPYDSAVYLGTGRVNAYKALTRYNTPPSKPEQPTGSTSGEPGTEYTYSTSTADTQGDQMYYMWEWGDGNFSEWLGPYESGGSCEAAYTWEVQGDYSIRVKAKDSYDLESDWSDPLPVSMPKTYETPLSTLIEKLFNWLEQIFGRELLPGIFNF